MATERASTGISNLLKVVVALCIIGALNWGLVGFFNWNLVDALFGGEQGTHSAASRVIYALEGLAGLTLLFTFPWRARELPTPEVFRPRRRAETIP